MSIFSFKPLFLAVFCCFFALPAYSQTAKKVNVSFIVAGDLDSVQEKNGRGGIAKLATVVKNERQKNANSIFAFTGDFLSPSILSGIDKGEHMIDLLNMVSPDFLVPGNHEFDFGADMFLQRMNEGQFTKLATNLRHGTKKLNGFSEKEIVEFQGVKIGFIGLTTENTPNVASPEYITFLPSVATAKKASRELKSEGVDMVVAIVHTSRNVDFQLLYEAGVDFVLSGHDHTLNVFYDGRHALVEAKEEGEYVVVADIEFTISQDDDSRKVRWWPNFRIVDTKTVAPAPEIAERVQFYENKIAGSLDEKIGKTNIEISTIKNDVRSSETIFGNLITDATRHATGADVAFENGGGIRGNKIYERGHNFTHKDILTEMPFGNVTLKLEISGEVLLAVLENSVSHLPEPSGRFLQVSNLQFDVDTKRKVGERISNVKIGGKKLDKNKKYTIATNDFLAKGGDHYTILRDAKILIGKADANLVTSNIIDYIKSKKTINSKIEGRINIK